VCRHFSKIQNKYTYIQKMSSPLLSEFQTLKTKIYESFGGEKYDSTLAEKRFVETLSELFDFAEELNVFIKEKKNPETSGVPDIYISVIKSGLCMLPEQKRGDLVSSFWRRASSHSELLKKRDLKGFRHVAPSLFPEIPDNIIASVASILGNDVLPTESVSDIFDFIYTLLRIAITREVVLQNEESDNDDLHDIQKKLEFGSFLFSDANS
jgi:hypothetical protein